MTKNKFEPQNNTLVYFKLHNQKTFQKKQKIQKMSHFAIFANPNYVNAAGIIFSIMPHMGRRWMSTLYMRRPYNPIENESVFTLIMSASTANCSI